MPDDGFKVSLIPDPNFGNELRKMVTSSLKNLKADFSSSTLTNLQNQIQEKVKPKITVGVKAFDLDQSQLRRLESRINGIAKSFDLITEASNRFAQNVQSKFPKLVQQVEGLNRALLTTRAYLGANTVNTANNKSITSSPVNNFSNAQSDALNKSTQSLDRFTKGTRDASIATGDFHKRVEISTKRLLAYAIPGKIIYELNSFVQRAKEQIVALDKEVNNLTQNLNGNVQAAEGLSDKVLSIGKAYGQSGNDILKITNILAKSKNLFSGNDDISRTVNNIAKSGLSANFSDMEKTTNGLISALNTFNLTGADTSSVLDAISKLSKDFSVNADDLFQGIENGGASFVSAGGNIKEYLAIFTQLKQTTKLSAPQIGQGINELFANINQPGAVAQANRLTGGRFSQQKNELGRLQSIADATRNYSADQLKPVIKDIFGTQETRFAVPLVRDLQNPNSQVSRATQDINNSAGSLNQDASTGLKSISAQLGAVTANFDEFFKTLSQSKGLQSLVYDINQLTSGLGDVLKFLTPIVPLFIKLAAVKTLGFGLSFLTKPKTPTLEGSNISVLGMNIGSINKRGSGGSGPSLMDALIPPTSPIIPSGSSNKIIEEESGKSMSPASVYWRARKDRLKKMGLKEVYPAGFKNSGRIVRASNYNEVHGVDSDLSGIEEQIPLEGEDAPISIIKEKKARRRKAKRDYELSKGSIVSGYNPITSLSGVSPIGFGDRSEAILLEEERKEALRKANATGLATLMGTDNRNPYKLSSPIGRKRQDYSDPNRLGLRSANETVIPTGADPYEFSGFSRSNAFDKIRQSSGIVPYGLKEIRNEHNITGGEEVGGIRHKFFDVSSKRKELEESIVRQKAALDFESKYIIESGEASREVAQELLKKRKLLQQEELTLEELKSSEAKLAIEYQEAAASTGNATGFIGPKKPFRLTGVGKFLNNDTALQGAAFLGSAGLSYASDYYGNRPQGSAIGDNGQLNTNFEAILAANAANNKKASIFSSAGTGLLAGSQIGSLIAPGIGTAIGAGIGLAGGLVTGAYLGNNQAQQDRIDTLGTAIGNAKDANSLGQISYAQTQDITNRDNTYGQDYRGKAFVSQDLKNLRGTFDDYFKTSSGQTALTGYNNTFAGEATLNADGSKKTPDQILNSSISKIASGDLVAARAKGDERSDSRIIAESSIKTRAAFAALEGKTNEESKALQALEDKLSNAKDATDSMSNAMKDLKVGLVEMNDRIEQAGKALALSGLVTKAGTFGRTQVSNAILGRSGGFQFAPGIADIAQQNIQSVLDNKSFKDAGGRDGLSKLIGDNVGNTITGDNRNALVDESQIQIFLRNAAKDFERGSVGTGDQKAGLQNADAKIRGEAFASIFKDRIEAAKKDGGELSGLGEAGSNSLNGILNNATGEVSGGNVVGNSGFGSLIGKDAAGLNAAGVAADAVGKSLGNFQDTLDSANQTAEQYANVQKAIAESLSQAFGIRLSRAREGTQIGENPYQISQNIGGAINGIGYNSGGLLNSAQNLASARSKDASIRDIANQKGIQNLSDDEKAKLLAADSALTQAQSEYDSQLAKSTSTLSGFRAQLEETTKQLNELQNTNKGLGGSSIGDVARIGIQSKIGASLFNPVQSLLNQFGVTSEAGLGKLTPEQMEQLKKAAPLVSGLTNNALGAYGQLGGYQNPNANKGETYGESAKIIQDIIGQKTGSLFGLGGGTQQQDLYALQDKDNQSIIKIENEQAASLDTIVKILQASLPNLPANLKSQPVAPIATPNTDQSSIPASVPVPPQTPSIPTPITQSIPQKVLEHGNFRNSITAEKNTIDKLYGLQGNDIFGNKQSSKTLDKVRSTLAKAIDSTEEQKTGNRAAEKIIKFDGNFNFTGFENTPQDKIVQMTLVKTMQEFATHLDRSDPAQAQLADKINDAARAVGSKSDGGKK